MHELFNTDRCVLLIYPRGASGKLLSNCLSMHDDFTFQHIKTALYPSPRDRFENLLSRIDQAKSADTWNDLGLGDFELYGTACWPADAPVSVATYQQSVLNAKLHARGLLRLMHDEKYFFRICHNLPEYEFYKQVWPNSQQILLTNANTWLRQRNRGRHQFGERPAIEGRSMLGSYHEFDCNSFADKDLFIQEYVRLLESFELVPMNLDLVSKIYHAYMKLYFNQ